MAQIIVGESGKKRAARWLLALSMIAIGIVHFVAPAGFVAIVPSWLPAPGLLVAVSGACEIAGGLGLLIPPVQRAAAFGLILLYLAVFPANVNMAVNHIAPEGHPLPEWALWGRLPFQALFIAWAWWLSRTKPAPVSAESPRRAA